MQFNFATVAFVAAAMTSLAAALPQSLLTELPADFEPGPVSGPELILEPVEVGDTTQPDLEKRQGRIIAYLYRDSNFNGENRALGTFPGQCGVSIASSLILHLSLHSPKANSHDHGRQYTRRFQRRDQLNRLALRQL